MGAGGFYQVCKAVRSNKKTKEIACEDYILVHN
jgi:hypothetical protein